MSSALFCPPIGLGVISHDASRPRMIYLGTQLAIVGAHGTRGKRLLQMPNFAFGSQHNVKLIVAGLYGRLPVCSLAAGARARPSYAACPATARPCGPRPATRAPPVPWLPAPARGSDAGNLQARPHCLNSILAIFVRTLPSAMIVAHKVGHRFLAAKGAIRRPMVHWASASGPRFRTNSLNGSNFSRICLVSPPTSSMVGGTWLRSTSDFKSSDGWHRRWRGYSLGAIMSARNSGIPPWKKPSPRSMRP